MNIEYDFLKVGSVVDPRPGYLYLDVGNRLGSGVIDVHHEERQPGATSCTCSLIADAPSLVTGWVDPTLPVVHIVLHESPDFDCIASSLLARLLLMAWATGQELPDDWGVIAPLLATSAARIDEGNTRLGLPVDGAPTPVTPYLSLLVLDDLAEKKGLRKQEAWRWMIEQGHRVLEIAVRRAQLEAKSDVDSIDLRGSLADLVDIEHLVDQRVQAFALDAVRIGLGREAVAGTANLDGIHDIELPARLEPGMVHQARIAFIIDPRS